MDIQILAVPYDSGHRGERMGAGPEALLQLGLERELRANGHRVRVKIAELPANAWHAEIETSFELMRMLASGVQETIGLQRFPLILAGNCSTAVGTLAGLGPDVGVAWFDAHGDFNTPETTTSGFLDGTAVAILTGRCWKQLAHTIPRFQPVSDERVCLVGTRDVDALERGLLAESNIQAVEPASLRSSLRRTLRAIGQHVDRAYVHLDLDVLDPGVATANNFAVAGGLTVDDVGYALSEIAAEFRIGALTLSAYDPAADTDGAAGKAAIELISTAAGHAGRV